MTHTTIQLKLDFDNHSIQARSKKFLCKAWKLPRKLIAQLSSPLSTDYEDFNICGVYLLFDSNAVYIGESEQVITRLMQYNIKPPIAWNTAIVFVSKDKLLKKSHTKYLEYKIFQKLKKIGRYEIKNTIIPKRSHISDEDTMQKYLENILCLATALGFCGFIEPNCDEETMSVGIGKGKLSHTFEKDRSRFFSSIRENSIFPFKIGKVMAYAFREALSKGILNDDINFLMSKESSRVFKTRGYPIIVSGLKPKKDQAGVLRYATEPVKCGGKTYWLTTQVYKEGLPFILSYLNTHGMSYNEIIKLCEKGENAKHTRRTERKTTKSFFEYLKEIMPKNSASTYSSAFRKLEKILVEHKILAVPLSLTVSTNELMQISNYILTDEKFKAYNRLYHNSLSAAWKKYVEYLQNTKC